MPCCFGDKNQLAAKEEVSSGTDNTVSEEINSTKDPKGSKKWWSIQARTDVMEET